MRVEIVINRDPIESPLNHFDRVIAFDAAGSTDSDDDIKQAISNAFSLNSAEVVKDEELF